MLAFFSRVLVADLRMGNVTCYSATYFLIYDMFSIMNIEESSRTSYLHYLDSMVRLYGKFSRFKCIKEYG